MSAGPPPLISLIVAMAQNGVIGRDNSLPWRLPEDLKRFRSFTRDRRWYAHGVIVVHSVAEAVSQAAASEELVAIGGAEIYRLLLPLARRMYLTHVHADVPGDITFPEFDSTQWADVECSSQPADEEHAYPLTFVTLERRYAPETPWHH